MDFARDFGYLDKFLAGLAKHADTLPPAQGARLKTLMAEEHTRWAEVKRLLAGEATSAPVAPTHAQPPAPAGPSIAAQPPQPAPVASSGPAHPVGLTVGSLIGVSKK